MKFLTGELAVVLTHDELPIVKVGVSNPAHR